MCGVWVRVRCWDASAARAMAMAHQRRRRARACCAGVVPASLARYIHLWQDIARAPLADDVADMYREAQAEVRRWC